MAKKPKAYYPVQRAIRLKDLTAAVAGGRFLQSTRLLSEANRRLYRQSYVYNLKVDVDIGTAMATAGVDVYVLRNTWDLHGAYKFAMKNYYNAMKEELQVAKGAQTRWHDFRVLPGFQADELVPGVNNPSNALPSMVDGRLTNGDHEFSQVVDSTGSSRVFTLDAATTATEWSIIDEWGEKDRVDGDPASASTSMPYDTLVENRDEANYDLLREKGEDPPYNDVADINIWQHVAHLQQVSPDGVTKLSSGFFDAPLGIVLLVSNGFTSGSPIHRPLTVTFQSGDYKGVKAPAYATPMLTESMEYEVV